MRSVNNKIECSRIHRFCENKGWRNCSIKSYRIDSVNERNNSLKYITEKIIRKLPVQSAILFVGCTFFQQKSSGFEVIFFGQKCEENKKKLGFIGKLFQGT